MPEQILTQEERKSIRAEIYHEHDNQMIDYTDGKIKFFIKHTRNKDVLDLGSVDHYEGNHKSRYWLFKAILQSASSVMGLDYYRQGVEALRAAGYDIVYGDAQNFNLGRKFDVVTAGDLIEHLPNLDGFISSMKSALNVDGAIVISTPNPWCWKYAMYHIIFGKLKPVNREHVSWFCLQTIDNLFNRYGFEIAEFSFSSRRNYEKYIPLPSRLKHTTLNVLLKFSNGEGK